MHPPNIPPPNFNIPPPGFSVPPPVQGQGQAPANQVDQNVQELWVETKTAEGKVSHSIYMYNRPKTTLCPV